MHNLFVRLAAGGMIAACLSATAFAANASIELTGPGSTNVITNSNLSSFRTAMRNYAAVGNWNMQRAYTGNANAHHNTKVGFYGLGTGNAYNMNRGYNNINVSNFNHGTHAAANFGGGAATIYLTGPGSFNRIDTSASNRVSTYTTNAVNAQNFSNQNARSGNLTITGNTLVTGVGSTGNAVNENTGVNTVQITNSANAGPWVARSTNGGASGSISTTGPNSYNRIGFNNTSRFTQSTTNLVNAQNLNQQSAQTGSVTISGNTVVSGVGGSGSAYNSNQSGNNIGISN